MLRTKFGTFNNELGFGIVDVMIATLILLLILGGVFALAQKAIDTNKLADETKNLATIRMGVSQLYNRQPYTGLKNSIGINAELFPEDMVTGTSVKNAWNGAVTLAVDNRDPRRFTITYADVEKAACIKLTSAAKNWYEVKVGTTVIDSVAKASTACNKDKNTIIFNSY